MQIPKLVLIACAAAIILPLSAHADTDAQMKAREALRDKMKELESQPAELPQSATPAPAPVKPAATPKATKPAPTPKSTPPPTAKAKPAPAQQAPATAIAEPATTSTKMGSTQVPAGNPAPAALQTTWNSEPLFGGRKKAPATVTPPKPKPVAAASTPAPKPVVTSASTPATKSVAQTTAATTTSASATTVPAATSATVPAATATTLPVVAAPAAAATIAPKKQSKPPVKLAQAESSPAETAPRPPKADSEKIARARDAMRQKMDELNTQQPGTPPPPAPEPVPPVANTQPAKPAKQAAKPVAKSNNNAADSGVFAPLPEASSSPARNVQLSSTPPPPAPAIPAPPAQSPMQPNQGDTAAAAPAPVPTRKASPKPTKNEIKPLPAQSFRPMEAPPVPFSNDKQQRLDALLKQYQADQITPAQYHEQRAKIIAEP